MDVSPAARQLANEIVAEYVRARTLHAPMHSPHEGYAVILEELDELKELVWRDGPTDEMREECIHIAAMALAFALELTQPFAEQYKYEGVQEQNDR